MIELANRMSRLGTETAFEVLAKAKRLEAQGKDIIHLQIGEPDFDTPDNIKDAAIKAIKEGDTKYTAVDGTPALKKAIVAKRIKPFQLGIRAKAEINPKIIQIDETACFSSKPWLR